MLNNIVHVANSTQEAAYIVVRAQIRLGLSDASITTLGNAVLLRAEDKQALNALMVKFGTSNMSKRQRAVICGRTGRVLN